MEPIVYGAADKPVARIAGVDMCVQVSERVAVDLVVQPLRLELSSQALSSKEHVVPECCALLPEQLVRLNDVWGGLSSPLALA